MASSQLTRTGPKGFHTFVATIKVQLLSLPSLRLLLLLLPTSALLIIVGTATITVTSAGTVAIINGCQKPEYKYWRDY